MPDADFRASMLRLRDDARLRIGMLTSLIASIEAIYALPPIVPASPEAPQPAAKKKPIPPRPPSPAPPVTNGAGQTQDDKVVEALKKGPLAPAQIRERTNIAEWALKPVMNRLMTAKKIAKSGTGPRNTKYQLTT